MCSDSTLAIGSNAAIARLVITAQHLKWSLQLLVIGKQGYRRMSLPASELAPALASSMSMKMSMNPLNRG